MNKQTHRTCVRMSAKEYNRLMERSRAAGLSANAWLMEQLAGNRPIISRNGIMSDFLCLLNQKGREINTVARACPLSRIDGQKNIRYNGKERGQRKWKTNAKKG